MNHRIIKKIRIHTQLFKVGRNMAVGNLRRLLHDAAKLARLPEAAITVMHLGCLNSKRGPAQ